MVTSSEEDIPVFGDTPYLEMLWFDFELYTIHLISSITNYIEYFFSTLNLSSP